MDVRSVDTSGMAAKRLETEKSLPVARILHGVTDERLQTHSAGEATGQDLQHSKVIRDDHEGHKRSFDSADTYNGETAEEETSEDKKPDAGSGGTHILDVKV